jgi:hypothetical protein
MMLSSGEGCKSGNLLQCRNKYQDARKPDGNCVEVQPPAHSGGAGGMLMGQDLMVVTTAGNYNRKDHSVPSLRVTGDAVLPSLL